MRRQIAFLAFSAVTLALVGWALWDKDTLNRANESRPAATKPPRNVVEDKPDPYFDVGQRILITRSGFRPAQLVAILDRPIRWVNDTNRTHTVVLDNTKETSGPIAPGETWTFQPIGAVSVTYHSKDIPKMRGAVQVEPLETEDGG